MTATLKTTIVQEPSSATANIQLGTSGQVGFGGANYGTAGQVLTSGGSGAAPSWSDGTPAGSVIAYAGSTAPSGWLLLFGQNISRTTYAALFSVIGTTYGAGDGSTTFTLPDLRGRAVAGKDDMGGTSANRLTGLTDGVDGDVLGGTGGLQSTTLTEAQLPAHTHTYTSTNMGGAGSASGVAFNTTGNSTTSRSVNTTGSGSAHNNVQPTLILNYIIKT